MFEWRECHCFGVFCELSAFTYLWKKKKTLLVYSDVLRTQLHVEFFSPQYMYLKKKTPTYTRVKCVAMHYCHARTTLNGNFFLSVVARLVRNCHFKCRCGRIASCSLCENNSAAIQMSQSDPTVRKYCSVLKTVCVLPVNMQVNWRDVSSVTQQRHPVCLALVCCGLVLNDMMHTQ